MTREPTRQEPAFNLLATVVTLEKQRRKLEGNLKEIKKKIAELSSVVLDEWADAGQQSANLDGLTVYVAQDFYCSKIAGVPTQDVCDGLKAVGLGDLIADGYSASALKARVKEWASEDAVPWQLEAKLNYDTVPRLRFLAG